MSELVKTLSNLMATIKQQTQLMDQCLSKRLQLMEALKHAANFLNELRTSVLSPKQYYELYIVIFDAMESLGSHLRGLHPHHHLSDLYELVQYAGNLVPRLYLMITAGTEYMRLPDAPQGEIMRDMLEMCRGVQHPLRGLFLRYYLMQRTKNLMDAAPIPDAIQFIITNFIEMNKLWVRLQHQGHSSQKALRTIERQQLQILVGSNLVRLSQLDGVDATVYREQILPVVMEQIVNCHDVLAQEYLVDVIIQIFPDLWHLSTMDFFLDRIMELTDGVSYDKVWVGLIDRLIGYGEKEEDEDIEGEGVEEARVMGGEKPTTSNTSTMVSEVTETIALVSLLEETATKGSNEDTSEPLTVTPSPSPAVRSEIFTTLFGHYTQLAAKRSLPESESSRILSSLCKLCIARYPTTYGFIDELLQCAVTMASNDSSDEWLALLLAPVVNYPTIITLLNLKHYNTLLSMQSEKLQRRIIGEILDRLLESSLDGEYISNSSDVLGICEYFKIVESSGLGSSKVNGVDITARALGQVPDTPGTTLLDEKVAKIFHLFRAESPLDTLALYKAVDRNLGSLDENSDLSAKQQRVVADNIKRQLYPTLIQSALGLVRQFRAVPANESLVVEIFRFVQALLHDLQAIGESPLQAELCLKLNLAGALIANHAAVWFGAAEPVAERMGEISYDFFVQSFIIYEEGLSDSRSQYQCLVLIIGKLTRLRITSRAFRASYETLITKATLYGSKLLKKPDQCRAVYLASHLWWSLEDEAENDNEEKNEEKSEEEEEEEEAEEAAIGGVGSLAVVDGKRVLECLQRSLRVADSIFTTATSFNSASLVSLELFVEILNQCIYYFIQGNEYITVRYVNGLTELILTNLRDLESQLEAGTSDSGITEVETFNAVKLYFQRTLGYIDTQKEIDERFQMVSTRV